MTPGLCAIAYVLGDIRETVTGWCRVNDRPEQQEIGLLRSGAHSFHRSSLLGQVDLATRATEQLLRSANLAASDLDLMIVCHTSPSNSLPAPMTITGEVKRRLGLNRAVGFSVGQQQCVSPVHALRVAIQMLQRDASLLSAVLLCADTLVSENLRPIGDAGIQSDGASAMLLRRGRGSAVSAIHTYNHPRATQGVLPDGRYETDPHYMWALVSMVRHVARAAGIGPADFASVLPHNINLPAWYQVLDALRIPRERLFNENFARVGHVFGSDIAINLADSRALHRPGHHLVVTSGIGGTFGGFAVHTS